MSLLDRGPHVVYVQPRRRVRDDLGAPRWVDDGPPVPVRGMVQPLESADRLELGLTVESAWKFIGRGPWPGDLHCRVSWEGKDYDQRGEARPRSVGRRTRHVVVRLVARGAEVRT